MSLARNVAVKIQPGSDVPRAPVRKKLRMPPVRVQSWLVNFLNQLKAKICGAPKPEHLRRGELGERAAEKYLSQAGLKFLAANFRSEHGEIDLIFRDGDCLCFIEVKARSSETWTRPAAAVDARKKKRLSQTALAYLHLLKNPEVKFRFDIVEVLLGEGEVREVRHLPNVFPLTKPLRYA